MSWLQLHGEVWPVTTDEAALRVLIQAPDVNCPRVKWWMEVSHYIKTDDPPAPGNPGIDRWLDIEVGDLILNLRDWRQLAGLEIRADSAWHDAQEFIGPYGHCYNYSHVTVYQNIMKHFAEQKGLEAGRKCWRAHDFILRFGNRDGWSFPLELDAWLIPEEEYYRQKPETPEETAQFAAGPPNFRLVTRVTFVTGEVEMTRAAADDPVSHAREILREQIAFDEMRNPELKWHLRSEPDGDKIVPMPGWRSRVFFYTPPERLL
jgi:hypothetical protein